MRIDLQTLLGFDNVEHTINIVTNNNNNDAPTSISWFHQDGKQVISNWWPNRCGCPSIYLRF